MKSQYLNAIKIFSHTHSIVGCVTPWGSHPLYRHHGCFCFVVSCSIRASFQVTAAEREEPGTSHLLLSALDWKRPTRLLPTRHWLVLVTWPQLRCRGAWETQPGRVLRKKTQTSEHAALSLPQGLTWPEPRKRSSVSQHHHSQPFLVSHLPSEQVLVGPKEEGQSQRPAMSHPGKAHDGVPALRPSA